MMEASNILDPDIESHLIALHYVYQPRIQESLNSFRTAWNNHGIRTAHRASPMQMWTAGMLSTRVSQRFRLLNVNVRGLFQLPPNDDTESELAMMIMKMLTILTKKLLMLYEDL